jgi:separase
VYAKGYSIFHAYTIYCFRKLDSNSYEKFHKVLVYNLGKCALNFLEKTSFSDEDLVITFCRTTLVEYAKSSIKDQFFKVN